MKSRKNYFITFCGIAFVIGGICLISSVKTPNEWMLVLPYLCIGVGCGIFGHGMGNFIAEKTAKQNPEFQKQMEILQKDERNLMISNYAKAKGYDLMTYAFGALLLIFSFMRVALIPLLLLVFVYLLVQGYALYYRMKYDKEM